MQTIDKRTALRRIKAVVKGNPTKVAVCHYVLPGTRGSSSVPECVAGVFMDNLGVDISVLPNDTFDAIMEKVNDPSNDSHYADLIRTAFGDVRLSKAATRLVTFIQALQDGREAGASDIIFGSWPQRDYAAATAFLTAVSEKQKSYDGPTEGEDGERLDSADRLNWSDALAFTVEHYAKF